MMRRAKIVATIGPASAKPQVLRALLKAGMDVARLNFSHGNHSDHAEVIHELRSLAKLNKCSVAILADLPGPKIRTGRLENNQPIQLRTGQRLTLTGQEIVGNKERVGISYRAFARDVHPRARILLDDGSIELRVLEKRKRDVICRVVNRGTLNERKGVNLPDTKLNIPSVTLEDKKHLRFALEHGVDYIGQSFVRKADDVRELKRLIHRAGYDTPVIAKIEKPEALKEIDKIMELADGVMVARGDLGVEMDLEDVPSAQRHIIAGANRHRIPVITATQMLQSMINNPRPTRAEVADVSAAIAQGTGAVMLSGETSVGKYPREAVLMMARIIRATEASVLPSRHRQPARDIPETVADTVADCVAVAAEQYHMAAIAVFTETGFTARLVSKVRPTAPIVAFSPRPEVYSRLALLWGVLPRQIERLQDVDHLIQEGERLLLREKLAKKGDLVAFVRSTRLHKQSKTNLLEFHTIGRLGGLCPTRG
jgi:pyruvate kinase